MRINNIYHCCVHKTGSQWIKTILSDDIIIKRTGFSIHTYQKYIPEKIDPRNLTKRVFHKAFPVNCIVSPLYMDYFSYNSIPKNDEYRTFCIIRDPRDIVVSWYFSIKQSHPLLGKIPIHREILGELSIKEGIRYCINYLGEFGLFDSLRSWIDAKNVDPYLEVFRFEDITDPEKQYSIFCELFKHCKIKVSPVEIKSLLNKYKFSRMKKRSNNSKFSHYRKGVPGEWKSIFDNKNLLLLSKVSKGAVEYLGYEN